MVRKSVHRLARSLRGVVRFNPAYFAFLSGIFVSLSINLITDLVFGSPEKELKPLEWLVTGTFFAAGIACAALASDLEQPRQHWIQHWRDADTHHGLKEEDVIQGALKNKQAIILIELVIGVVTSAFGTMLLIFLAITH